MEDEKCNATGPAPRVQITYDVDTGDGVERHELPFVVGVLSEFAMFSADSDRLPKLRDRRFIDIDQDNFDVVMGALSPRVRLDVPNQLGGSGDRINVDLRFSRLADFEPKNIARQVEPLCRLLDVQSGMAEGLDVEPALNDGLLGPRNHVNREVEDGAQADTRVGDERVSRQLDEILHAPEFQRAEAAWRGLYYLVTATRSSMIKVRILYARKAELLKDVQRALTHDQSAIYKKIHEEAYGVFGGEPYAVLIGDYEFGASCDDVELFQKMSVVSAEAHVPFIAAASPAMFLFDNFTDLLGPRSLERIFDGEVYSHWNRFREQDEARYSGLVLPRFLLRLPFGSDGVVGENFNYKEHVDGTVHDHYLWGNSAYAFAARLTEAFAKHGWCAPIRGVQGGLVPRLPVHVFVTAEGDVAMKCPTEIPIPDAREAELRRLGFIPLCHRVGTNMAVFFSVPSCYDPKARVEPDTDAESELGPQLDDVLAVSRFAHYIKATVRDYIGCSMTREALERFLNHWISQYVVPENSTDLRFSPKALLQEGRIQLYEAGTSKIASYRAVAHLRPRFQLGESRPTMQVEILLPTYAR